MLRRLLILTLLLAAAGGGYYYWRSRPAEPLILTGIVTEDGVVVSSQIQGQIQQLLVNEGDHVKAGQLLATIAPQEFKADQAYFTHSEEGYTAQVQQAEAALRYQELQTRDQITQAEAALAGAESQQAEATAELERARLDYERASNLFKQGIVAPQVNDQARTAFQAAQARVQTLRKQVDAQKAAVALARSNAEQIAVRRTQLEGSRHQVAAAAAQKQKAQVRLGYTEIRSPIDGMVDTRAALQGEIINPAQPILTLINEDGFWVRADVPETEIDRIHLGDHMTVRLPSGAERDGTVFYRSVDASFATQRDVSRTKRDIKTFEIRLRVDNSDRALGLGMTGYVVLPPRSEPHASVPRP